MKDWRAWMGKYLPAEDARRPVFVNGYNSAVALAVSRRETETPQFSCCRKIEAPMSFTGHFSVLVKCPT
jgi:hypothetical protein